MAKIFTKDDVIQNKKEAIKALNKMLEHFINDRSDKHLKKAHLISYWLKDYVQMLEFEEIFDPTKNISYKRGNIVKLNFGFNIGSEYGGLHYAVVLDKKNDHNSPVLTVLPLTSIKNNKSVHPNSVELGNDIYRMLKIKYDTISKSLKEEEQDLQKTRRLFDAFISMAENSLKDMGQCSEDSDEYIQKLANTQKYIDTATKLKEDLEQKSLHNKEQQEYLKKIGREISQMKEGSIALINQITTVSKLRIFDPRNLKGVLANVSLSEENMEKINQKVKDLYIF